MCVGVNIHMYVGEHERSVFGCLKVIKFCRCTYIYERYVRGPLLRRTRYMLMFILMYVFMYTFIKNLKGLNFETFLTTFMLLITNWYDLILQILVAS